MALKLSVLVVTVLIAVTAVQGWIIAEQQSEMLEQELHKFAFGTTQLIVRQVKEPLLSQDDLTLEQIIQSAIQHQGVAGVEIRDSNGNRITGSGEVPTAKEPMPQQPLLWSDQQQRPYISYVAQAYSNDLKVGEVLVTYHADVLDQVKNKARDFVIYSTLLVIVVGIVLSVLISTIVTSPIRNLIKISRRIAAGEYQIRFNKQRNDELGILIESLNQMTDKLLHKIHVEQTFSRYVSPKVAKEVLADLAPQELGGKEVDGSVLFADIVSFTSISENLAADKVSQLLNDYFTYIDRAAYQCDGHVDKYMGDCAMLLFGIPEQPSEDHETDAIYCALLIQRIIEQLNQQRSDRGEVTVEFSIGVNCGTMLAGNMGSRSRMEYTVLGDTVNIASRLAAVAAAGEIIITSSVANEPVISGQFNCQQGESIILKGKKAPVTVYNVASGNEETEERLQRDMGIVFATIEAGEY
jgi:adenylate cyclase